MITLEMFLVNLVSSYINFDKKNRLKVRGFFSKMELEMNTLMSVELKTSLQRFG